MCVVYVIKLLVISSLIHTQLFLYSLCSNNRAKRDDDEVGFLRYSCSPPSFDSRDVELNSFLSRVVVVFCRCHQIYQVQTEVKEVQLKMRW